MTSETTASISDFLDHSQGNPIDFLLSPMRDAEAAKHFFLKALHFTAIQLLKLVRSRNRWPSPRL